MLSPCLINMNARIYDASLGMFISADTMVPDPYDLTSYDRYSYVGNNPLSYIDPTGRVKEDPTAHKFPWCDAFTYCVALTSATPCWGCSGPGIDDGQALGYWDRTQSGTWDSGWYWDGLDAAASFGPSTGYPTGLVAGGSGGGSLGDGQRNNKQISNAQCQVPAAPPGADIDKNIQTARDISNALHVAGAATLNPGVGDLAVIGGLYFMFRNHGPYDYKQLGGEYDDFGNFNYGAMGNAMGVSDQLLLRGAGWAQMQSGNYDPSFGNWSGGPPYGDDPEDQGQIKNGINYGRNCHGK